MALMTRDAFREGVFARDKHLCVLCHAPAQDAHHIIERRLFPDGGYWLDNGASVCGPCHLDCEMTLVSPDELRQRAGISSVILPAHFYTDRVYDKWGNVVLANGSRLRGDLFFDESVQKILAAGNVLSVFLPFVQYQRTPVLPWSECKPKDDRILQNDSSFHKQRVIATRKMDGINVTLYQNMLHGRHVDRPLDASHGWMKNFHASISHDIPKDWRICGEYLGVKQSLSYNGLPSFFMGFSIWNDKNQCLDWDETLEWFALLGITPVDVLYDGMYESLSPASLWNKDDSQCHEGYVLRNAHAYPYREFGKNMGKFIRASHDKTAPHGRAYKPITYNTLE